MAPRGLGKGLGKGLDALISPDAITPTQEKEQEKSKDGVTLVKIIQVEPNREQPRKQFEEESLQELADSIKQYGLLQPLLVQNKKDHYEIIAGERRWRAAKLAGLKEIPVMVKDYSSQEAMEISLIENIQRQDLNPIEEALAFKRLLEEFHLKQEEVAERVSKSRAAVTNSLRLLKLTEEVQQMLIEEKLTMGHARTLITVEDPKEQYRLAQKIWDQKLSVRDAEKLVKKLQEQSALEQTNEEEKSESGENAKSKEEEARVKHEKALQAIYDDLGDKLKQSLGTKVTVTPKGNGSGKIEIEFYSHDDLDRLMELLSQ